MRFTIIQIMIFTGLVAAQVQSPTMMSWGLALTLLTLFFGTPVLAFSALFSDPRDGQLDVDSNPIFRIVQFVLIVCCINLVTLLVLIPLFPHSPTF